MSEHSQQMNSAPILITGAGKRVGLHLAMTLITAGYPVIAHVHHHDDAQSELRARALAVFDADLSATEQVLALAAHINQLTPSLRGIIHNASSFARSETDLLLASAQFDHFFRVHMLAPYLLNEALSGALLACTAEHADIIHITDIYADRPNPLFDTYCATKAGLQNLAFSYARKLSPKVKVNCIQPGPILFKDWHTEAVRQQVLSETLLAKEGGVEAIALAVRAVLENPYQTGAVIAVDGGRRLT